MYTPQLYLLNTDNLDSNILNEKNDKDVYLSSNIPQPAIDMGFHSFLSQNKKFNVYNKRFGNKK